MKTAKELGRNDVDLLRLVMQADGITEEEHMMLCRWLIQVAGNKRELSKKQRSWLEDMAHRLDIVEPSANLVSSGLVPRGAEVPTPPVLLNRPLRPPGRR